MKVKVFSLIAALVISSAAMASDLQLETIGAAGGSNLYLTYLSIGVIADSHTKDVYDKEQAKSFVNSIVAQAKVQKDYLDKLLKSKEVTGEDALFLKKMIDCYTLLMDEGKFFIEYVNTGKESSLTAYDAKRQQAWALISELLGFDK
jgi:hypothetical protein